MVTRRLLALACSVSLASCADITGTHAGDIATRFVTDGIEVANPSSAPIFYFAIDRQAAASVSWAPCTDPASCPRIQSRDTKVIDFREVAFWSPTSDEAIVFWWHLVQTAPGKFAPDSIRADVVLKR